jgi:cell division protein FtsI/penicillin-binding protein 2
VIAAGQVFKPRLLWQVKNPYTGIIEKEYKPELLNHFKLKPKTLEIVREGLRRVTLTGSGTYHKYLSSISVAGKTGSAQNVKSKTHSWFISYGPLDKPLAEQYAITVMVEQIGHGGSIAVPISSILYNFLEGKMDRERALKTIIEIFNYQEQKGEKSVQD